MHGVQAIANAIPAIFQAGQELAALMENLARALRPGDQVLVMSNGGFGGIHRRLLERLARSPAGAAAR